LQLLFGILVLSAALRFYALDSLPSLNQDEAVFGFEAFSVAETGRDEWGAAAPVIFTEFGGYSLPFYIYFLAPFVKLFGLSVFVTRFPSALFGVLLCVAAFFLCKRIFNEKGELVGLAAALLVAVTPSLVHLNRLAFSASLLPFFVVAGAFFLFNWLSGKREKREREERDLFVAAALFSLSLYTYATAKLFVPLLFLGFAALYRRELWSEKRAVIKAAAVFLVVALPLLYASVFDAAAANARFDSVSVFHSENWIEAAASDYGKYFDVNYLFVSGDHLLTHSADGLPQIPLFALPLCVLAVALLLFRSSKEKLFLLWWLVAFPVAGALTLPAPHALRGTTLTPLLQIFSAFALVVAFDFARKNWVEARGKLAAVALAALLVFGAYSVVSQLDYYYDVFPSKQAAWFSYGYREAVGEANALAAANNASEIVVTRNLNQPYVFFLFFERYPPALFQNEAVVNDIRPGVWSDVRSFGGHRFCDPAACFDSSTRAVFVVRGDELPDVTPAETVHYPDGGVAFKIIFKP